MYCYLNLGFCGWKFENYYRRTRLESIPESISKSIPETIILGLLCIGNAIAIPDTKIIFLQYHPMGSSHWDVWTLAQRARQPSGTGCFVSVTQNSSYSLPRGNQIAPEGHRPKLATSLLFVSSLLFVFKEDSVCGNHLWVSSRQLLVFSGLGILAGGGNGLESWEEINTSGWNKANL